MEAPVHTPEQESALHEHEHIHLRGMIKFVVWFIVILFAAHAFVYAVYGLYKEQARGQTTEITGLSEARIPPPEPRLQPSIEHDKLPRIDLEEMRRRDTEAFKVRGWLTDSGEVRVKQADLEKVIALTAQPSTRSAK